MIGKDVELNIVVLGLVGCLVGWRMVKDSQGPKARVEVAKRRINDGMSETDAMSVSKCNWWGSPWYAKVGKQPFRLTDSNPA